MRKKILQVIKALPEYGHREATPTMLSSNAPSVQISSVSPCFLHSQNHVHEVHMHQEEIAHRLIKSVNEDNDSYENIFNVLSEVESLTNKLDNNLLSLLVDIIIREDIDFSIRDTVFEIVRRFAADNPTEVLDILAHKHHSDYIFDEIIISDMIKSNIDAESIVLKYRETYISNLYKELLDDLKNT